ncbi:MAG: tetratricopeptide repeat protein [Proteobacteria bacterium]|nr:tetratricopeptide repeat protein [Desulfobulbaceae bacterium]MBU4151339.1 tetratricopeptide repeat protein [Pseudomonadota bacterium]
MIPNHSSTQSSCCSPLPIILTLAVIGFMGIFPIQDFDIFWHLANGRAMVEQGAIINQEIFSFTAAGKHFSNHAWLAQILLFLIFKTLGANGLIAAKILITTAIGLCLYLFSRRQGLSPLPAALVWLLAFAASHFRYVVRPELFSSLFLAITGVLLFSYRTKPHNSKLLIFLPIIMGFWDFMHGALYGTIFLTVFLGAETIRSLLTKNNTTFPLIPKKHLSTLWLWASVTIILMALSPYGLRTYDIFLEFMNQNLMTSMTAEFQPTSLGEKPLFWGLLILTSTSILAAGRNLDLTSLTVLIPFAGMAIRYVRGIGPFSIVAAVILAVNLPPLLTALTSAPTNKKRQSIIGIIILTGAILFAVYYKLSPPLRYDSLGLGISAENFPVGSTRFIKSANLSGNMYNTDRYGGYLAYYLYPERKIFHYNHHMLFDALERYVHEPETRAQWQINYAIIGRSDEWDMFSKEGFIPIYWEPTGAVLIRNSGENRALIDRYRIRYFSPLMPRDEFMRLAQNPMILPTLARETSDYLAQRHDQEKTKILAELLIKQSSMPATASIELLSRAEGYNNDSPELASTLGTLYYRQGVPEKASQYLRTALALDKNLVEARFSLAYLLYDQHKFEEAVTHFTQILATNPRHPDTMYGLGLCNYQLGRKQEAARAFQGYLTLAPDGPWAEKSRNFLVTIQLGS